MKRMISDQLMEEMKAAMKSGDKIRLSVIRMLRADLENARIASGEALTKEQEQKIIASYAKKRKEAMDQYEQSGRQDLADQEKAEHAITMSYLPTQMDEGELTAIVQAKIAELGATNMKEMGSVMKAVVAEVKGRADGSTISAAVKKILSG